MKITTRHAVWGIELKNDTVTEEIGNSSQQELNETMINFLEAVKDMSEILNRSEDFKEDISDLIDNIIFRLELES